MVRRPSRWVTSCGPPSPRWVHSTGSRRRSARCPSGRSSPDASTTSGSLTHDKTPAIENDAVRQWIANVEADPAYVDLLSVFRHVMTHRTTPMALYARAHNANTFGEAPDDAEQETPGLPDWEGRPPHQGAPGLYLTDNRGRSIGAVELLDKVTPSVERHVRAALDLVRTGLGRPDDGPYHFREWPPKQGRQTSQNAPRHPGLRGRDEATSQGLRRRSTQPGA